MADDNRIEIVASLDKPKSVSTITNDLSWVTDKLNVNRALKVTANIDLSKTTQRIQSQLATISSNLTINVPKISFDSAGGISEKNKVVSDVTHIADEVDTKIEEIRANLAKKFGVDVSKIVTNTVKNAKGEISSFSFELTKLGGSIEKFNYKISQKKNEGGSSYLEVTPTTRTDSNRGAIKLAEQQIAQVSKLEQKLKKLKEGFADVNAPRPILDEENIEKLNQEFVKTDDVIKKIKSSTSETFSAMVSDANAAVSAYEELGKALRNAENTATDFSSNDIGSAKSLLGGKIDKFITNASKSSIADANAIVESAQKIKKSLDSIKDSNGLKTARDDFNKLRGEFASLDAAAKGSSFAETLRNRIEKLSATLTAFAAKNERAVKSTQAMSSGKTFAQEWQELSNALTKGDLKADELRHLQERFTIFGKEAEAAGLKGKTAWEKFLNTFKTFSSYITANMVFNMFKNQIRSMVQEVVNLDSAMTELRKVTEATEPEFNKFLETAKKSAQYLGSSVTDLVDATSTFSRLGYSLNDAQKLGEIATLYKNVGDGIDISTASETLVSTLKAFDEFNNEATDAIRIVDKLNEVGNNFAISSGGIGEALLRSASAMATANNDLSQTIALITTANTIAQNPESVGTGLKTMALRLRSTKTEIEEMGEDAEGAAENVSKLREQVLALTKNKVDIQIDANTYKSSYDILLEISKVWNELNDISKASLLEQLFGKRQANIGSAILENGELLQQVYETAENSIGSATEEQEKFAKSIQYSINSFKAAYQSLASDVAKSEFVKSLVDIGSEIVKGLDAIITKTGILQGILVGFGSLAIFKTVPVLIAKIKSLGSSLIAFGSIMNTLGTSGGNGQALSLQQLAMASKQLTDRQFELVLSTKSLTEAQMTAMMEARGFTQEQIAAQVAIMNQTAATNGLTTAERGATVTTFSLSGAIKGLSAAIAANPIGAIVTAVTLLVTVLTSLKRKREEAIVEAKRLEEERQQNLESTINELKAFENEQKAIDGIVEKYTALYNTTDNIASKKDELADITNELTEKLGNEKTQIDLVNKSLSENIELIRQQQTELDRQWQRDNKAIIEEAQKYAKENSALTVAEYKVSDFDTDYEEAKAEANFYFSQLKNLIDKNNKDLWKYLDVVEEEVVTDAGYLTTRYALKLKEGLGEDVVPEVLKSFRTLNDQLYNQFKYINFDWIDVTENEEALNQYISDWEKYSEILVKNNEINNELWDNSSIGIDDTTQRFNDLIDAASKASQKMNAEDVLPADVYIYSRQIENIQKQLEELAAESPELQKRMELAFSTIGLSMEDASESADLLKKTFFNTLDEMEKGVFDKVDTINEAITKVISGEGIDADKAWELIDLDTTGILNPVINANGEWIIQEKELIALKERLIGLSKEQVEADMKAAQDQIAQLDKEIAAQYAIIDEQQEIIAKQARGNTKPNEENVKALSAAKAKVNELTAAQKKYTEEVHRDNLLLQQLSAGLNYTVEQLNTALKRLNEDVDKLDQSADNLLKAQEYRIDRIIDGHKDELKVLNDEKQALQDELDELEKQKDAIEDIISNYDTVNKLVQTTVQKEIDALEEQKKEIEDTYNKRIEALKAENKEREDALDYAQKLKNLENAKNNKTRVYDEARGWHYASNQDDIKKAQNELADYETNKAIEQLEAERDALLDATEDIIDSKEKYSEQWKEIADKIQEEADEELAKEILGADWREKIAKGDLKLLADFTSKYTLHNVKLKNLTNTEIALKNQAIEAKEAEIDAKNKQIESWQNYRDAVEEAAKEIKDANEDYMKIVRELDAEEPLTLENRANAFENFKNRLTGYIDEIGNKKYEIEELTRTLENCGTTVEFNIESNVQEVSDEMIEFINSYRDAVVAMREALDSSSTGYGTVNSAWDAKLAEAANKLRLLGYSEGGTADYTGLAMLHGTKNRAETIFNAADSRKLYNYVHNTPDLISAAMSGALKKSGVTSTVSIGSINVTANNPQEFTRGLDKTLDKYFRTKLTASYAQS